MNKNLTFDLKTGILKVNIDKIRNNYNFEDLFGVSSRINKKRGFVFISKVLGKHYPSKPSKMNEIHFTLANKLINNIYGQKSLIIGFAETAVGIGFGVFEQLSKLNNTLYNKNTFIFQHSTRYLTNNKVSISFEEEHCHAPSHIFYEINENNEIMEDLENIVLVDDEVSTGNTSLNFIKELHNKYPKVKNYYVVSILNWIDKTKYENITNYLKENNIFINFISIVEGTFEFESKNIEITSDIQSICKEPENLKDYLTKELNNNYGRYGIKLEDIKLNNLINKFNINNDYIDSLKNKKVLVLGTGEFMHIPYLIGKYLEDKNINVYLQSTTRSPLNIDNEIKSILTFKDNYGENIDNFLYNVVNENYDEIIICYETKTIPSEHDLKNQLSKISNIKELFF